MSGNDIRQHLLYLHYPRLHITTLYQISLHVIALPDTTITAYSASTDNSAVAHQAAQVLFHIVHLLHQLRISISTYNW